MRNRVRLVLVQEVIGLGQEERCPVEFETLLAPGHTPPALVAAGIYSEIAVPLKGAHWRATGMALLTSALADGQAWHRGAEKQFLLSSIASSFLGLFGNTADASNRRSSYRASSIYSTRSGRNSGRSGRNSPERANEPAGSSCVRLLGPVPGPVRPSRAGAADRPTAALLNTLSMRAEAGAQGSSRIGEMSVSTGSGGSIEPPKLRTAAGASASARASHKLSARGPSSLGREQSSGSIRISRHERQAADMMHEAL